MRRQAMCLAVLGVMTAPVQAQPETFPMDAGSWGGNLRAGPSVGSADIGSLGNGDPIVLLERSPETFNGYSWFRIRTRDGQEGYQWGGIICGYGAPIKGAFETCETDPGHTGAGITSVYTSLDPDGCETIEYIEEGGSVTQRCPGYDGIDLIVQEGDGRLDVDVRTEDGDFTTLSPFNVTGEVAEWRLMDEEPYAIIYRLRTATPEVAERSRLFIKTVPGPGEAGCLVGTVDGAVPEANARAREIADRLARGFVCGQDTAEILSTER